MTAFVNHDLALADEIDQLGAAPKKRGTPERDAQQAVVAWLRNAGCLVHASVAEQAARSKDPVKRARFGAMRKRSGVTTGWPDLTVITPGGKVFWLEMKAPKGRLSEAQAHVHREMRERGQVVLVATDIWTVQQGMEANGISLLQPRRRAIPLVEGA